jgi:mono/diheme cytochrome c family protein
MKYFFLSFLLAVVTVISFAGFRGQKSEVTPYEIFPDMDDQAKVKPQRPSSFFEDGQAMRHPVAGTMPMGFEVPAKPASSIKSPADFVAPEFEFTHGTGYYYTGKEGDYYGDGLPPEVKPTTEFLKRGQERYNIHCAICHGVAGNGKGVVSASTVFKDESRYTPVAPLDLTGPGLDDPANAAYRTDGKIYDSIVNGSTSKIMGGYGANISVQDRWAIVAYIRALQFAAKNPVK